MKKLLYFMLILISAYVSAYEHTGGGILDSNLTLPDINGTIIEASSKDSFFLWYEGSFNDFINLSLKGGLVFQGSAGFAANISKEFAYLGIEGDYYPDITSANIYGNYQFLSYRLGRQVVSDASGMIYSHPVDGFKASLWLGSARVRGKIGYTGLVHRNASKIAMTRNDLIEKNGSIFGSPRLLEEIGLYYPELAGTFMNLDLSFIAQQDLLKDSEIQENSAKMNSFYSQLQLDGFLLPYLAYKGGFVYQFGTFGDLESNGYATDLQVILIPGRGNSFFMIEGFLSSGETWNHRRDYYGQSASGAQNQFLPIASSISKGYVLAFDPGNISSVQLLMSLSKNKKFATEISTTALWRTVNGPTSSTMIINNGEKDLFIGQEALLAFKFRPTSDFGASIKTGALYRGDSVTLNDLIDPYLPVLFRLSLDVSLSF